MLQAMKAKQDLYSIFLSYVFTDTDKYIVLLQMNFKVIHVGDQFFLSDIRPNLQKFIFDLLHPKRFGEETSWNWGQIYYY